MNKCHTSHNKTNRHGVFSLALSHTIVITHIRKQLLFNYSPHSSTHSRKSWAFDLPTFPRHLRFTLHHSLLIGHPLSSTNQGSNYNHTHRIPARSWASEIDKGKAMFINYFTWNIIYIFLKKEHWKYLINKLYDQINIQNKSVVPASILGGVFTEWAAAVLWELLLEY